MSGLKLREHGCPKCGKPVNAGARFCKHCAFDLLIPAEPEAVTGSTHIRPCPFCGTMVKESATFCPNCGRSITQGTGLANTIAAHTIHPRPSLPDVRQPLPVTSAPLSQMAGQSQRRPTPALIAAAVIALLFLAAFAYYRLRPDNSSVASSSELPDHYGLYMSQDGKLEELARRDVSDMLQGRDAFAAETALAGANAYPTFILYAEAQDIPLTELKLVQLDSINNTGSIKYWNYQVGPIEGRPGMKKIQVKGGLASGKYAFAIISGYLTQGNHKFWPFQVMSGATPSESAQVSRIPVVAETPKTVVTQQVAPPSVSTPLLSPDGGKAGYCTSDNVVLRNGPSLDAEKVDKLYRGQKLRVISVSSNSSLWRGINSTWTEVQLENSSVRGWVFSYFVAYD